MLALLLGVLLLIACTCFELCMVSRGRDRQDAFTSE
jgi:hypothetical protein